LQQLKNLFLILVVIGIVIQTMSKCIICINFQINREYIAKNLCIKKKEIKNSCKGKCHLKKQLDEEDKKESPADSKNGKELNDTQLFCYSSDLFMVIEPENAPKNNTPYLLGKFVTNTKAIFHPPKKNFSVS